MDINHLISVALKYRARAYAPTCHFKAGAALLAASGKVYGGCNIENSAYSPSLCAERVAFAKAISEGEESFLAIAVAGGHEKETVPATICPPCGVCRQTMVEFCKKDFLIILPMAGSEYQSFTLDELLPYSFNKEKVLV